jgi:hypothetical protein
MAFAFDAPRSSVIAPVAPDKDSSSNSSIEDHYTQRHDSNPVCDTSQHPIGNAGAVSRLGDDRGPGLVS